MYVYMYVWLFLKKFSFSENLAVSRVYPKHVRAFM